jgi:hypothetical protein
MKKYLLGLFAVVLAVGFSAFTSDVKVASSDPDQDLYWYVVENGFAKFQQPVFGEQLISKNELLNEEPQEIPCEVGSLVDCIRGFEEPLSQDVAIGQLESIRKD